MASPAQASLAAAAGDPRSTNELQPPLTTVSAEQTTRTALQGEARVSAGAPAQAGRQAADSPAPGRFGVRLAGLPVLFPAGEMLEYHPEVTVWRIPLAPARLAGLMQLRGHPVPVFDAGRAPADAPPNRAAVLVVGDAAGAAALIVESAPLSVELADAGPHAGRRTGDEAGSGRKAPQGETDPGLDDALDELAASVCFRAALGEPQADRSGRRWWPVAPAQLFDSLAGEARDD